MKVNGYEVGQEPTDEEFRTYMRVKGHYERLEIAQWLGGYEAREIREQFNEHEPLNDGEFDRLFHRFSKLDFSAEEWNALAYEYEEILAERR